MPVGSSATATPQVTTMALHRLWMKRLTRNEICASSGIRFATLADRIKRHRARHGLFPARPVAARPFVITTPALELKWRKLWQRRWTYAEIAQLEGTTIRAVNRRMMKMRAKHPDWFPKRSDRA